MYAPTPPYETRHINTVRILQGGVSVNHLNLAPVHQPGIRRCSGKVAADTGGGGVCSTDDAQLQRRLLAAPATSCLCFRCGWREGECHVYSLGEWVISGDPDLHLLPPAHGGGDAVGAVPAPFIQ
jgi:hypothetical protein